MVTHPEPVDPHEKADREDHGGYKVDLPDSPHDEIAEGFPIRREQRMRDVQAGEEEHDQAGGIHPMRDADRQLPHVFAPEILFRTPSHFARIEFRDSARHTSS